MTYGKEFSSVMSRLLPKRSSAEANCTAWNRISLSVTIMAYKDRVHRIPHLRKILGNAAVSLDTGAWGLWENAKRSWLSYSSDSAYHMVIQDDAVPCRDLYSQIEEVVAQNDAPRIVSLYFRLKSDRTHREFNEAARNSFTNGGFSFSRVQFAVSLIAPTAFIEEMIAFADQLDPEKYKNKDDLRFSAYLRKSGMAVHYPLPSLVDHWEDGTSLIGNGENGTRRATWFRDGPNGFINKPIRIDTSAELLA